MEKKLSCGFIIKDIKTGLFLGCVPTGSKDGLCDVPKGGVDAGESHYRCAVRELYEETGIEIYDEDVANVIWLGRLPYLRNKDLVLYYIELPVDFDSLHCDSTFEMYGKTFPEMSGYKLGDLSIFRKALQNTIKLGFENNKLNYE